MAKTKIDLQINEAELERIANDFIKDTLKTEGFNVKCPLCGADMTLKAEGNKCPSCGEFIMPKVG